MICVAEKQKNADPMNKRHMGLASVPRFSIDFVPPWDKYLGLSILSAQNSFKVSIWERWVLQHI